MLREGIAALALLFCACGHAQAERRAVHVGASHSGIASPRYEVLVRSDGLVCFYDSSRLYAGRLSADRVDRIFAELDGASLPAVRTRWRHVGAVPGGGGCDSSTHGSIMTIVKGNDPPRSMRVLYDDGLGDEDARYVEGDAALEATIARWWIVATDAVAESTPVAPEVCAKTRIDGVTATGWRRTSVRKFWPRSPSLWRESSPAT